MIFGFLLSAVGFFASLFGARSAQTAVQKRMLSVLTYIHAIVAILAIFMLLYFLIKT